jgi:hypothetical protein
MVDIVSNCLGLYIWADLGNISSGPCGNQLGRRWLLAKYRLGLTCGLSADYDHSRGNQHPGFRLGKEIELQVDKLKFLGRYHGGGAVSSFHQKFVRGSAGGNRKRSVLYQLNGLEDQVDNCVKQGMVSPRGPSENYSDEKVEAHPL